MGQQDVPYQREADALTVALGAEEGGEQALADFGCELWTVVFNDHRRRLGSSAHPDITIAANGFEGIFGNVELTGLWLAITTSRPGMMVPAAVSEASTSPVSTVAVRMSVRRILGCITVRKASIATNSATTTPAPNN